MKLIALISLTLILITSKCTLKTQHILEYIPEKLQTQNLTKINIELNGVIELEESENNIIQQISSVAINGQSNTLAIIKGNDLCVYDYSNGKYLKKIRATFEMTDLVANSDKKPYVNTQHFGNYKSAYYVGTSNYSKYNISEDVARNFIKKFLYVYKIYRR